MYLHLNLHKNRYEICFFRALGEVEVIFSKTPEDFRDYLKSLSYKWGLAKMTQKHTTLVLGHTLKQWIQAPYFTGEPEAPRGWRLVTNPRESPRYLPMSQVRPSPAPGCLPIWLACADKSTCPRPGTPSPPHVFHIAFQSTVVFISILQSEQHQTPNHFGLNAYR